MSQTCEVRDKNIKGIFFDMDNTLFDFVHSKMLACQSIIDYLGQGNPDDLLQCFVTSGFGFENPENIKHYMKSIGLKEDVLYYKCQEIYEAKKIEELSVYPFVEDTLAKLKTMDIPIVVVTDADSSNATRRLKKTGLDDLVDELITCDITGAKKPSSKVFQHVLDKFKLLPDQAIYVGDSIERDIEPAKKLGIITIHAAYGDRNFGGQKCKYEEPVPDHVIGCISEIIELI